MTAARTYDLSRRKLIALGLGAYGAFAMRATGAQPPSSYTFVVLGTDYRSPEEAELTDVMMVSRVNLEAGTVRTMSFPRDLWVDIPGVGFGKINGAFNHAIKADPEQRWQVGAAASVATIEHNFGLQIDGTAMTDVKVFPHVVDAIGGVVVNNPYALTTIWGTTYPAGEVFLDGENAHYFTRDRMSDGDDGRVMRQHLVLQEILEKLQEPAILLRIPQLIATLSGDVVRTDIPASVQARLIPMLPTLSNEDLAFINLTEQLFADYSADGQWIYNGDWSVLPGYVQSWLDGA